MNDIYEWNPVFNFFMDIKYKYIEKFGQKSLYDISDCNNCLKNWVEKVGTEEDKKICNLIDFNQYGSLVLIRYKGYEQLYSAFKSINEVWEMNNGFLLECRSLVIDIVQEKIVLCPFKKFFNIDEVENTKFENIKNKFINSNIVEVSDKMDGSMQCATFYNNKIVTSGSQSLDMEKSWRLKDGYRMMLFEPNLCRMIKESEGLTFIFEYISLEDAHVVTYSKDEQGLYLIGVRDNLFGTQMPYLFVEKIAKDYNVDCVKTFNKSFEDIIQDTKNCESSKKEGYVLYMDGFMAKIKCNDYAKIHKSLGKSMSVNTLIESMANNTFDDLYSKIPDSRKEIVLNSFNEILNIINVIKERTEKMFVIAKENSQDKKSFMIFVDSNTPKSYRGYVKNLYFGIQNNFLRMNEKSKKCKKLNELKELYANEQS